MYSQGLAKRSSGPDMSTLSGQRIEFEARKRNMKTKNTATQNRGRSNRIVAGQSEKYPKTDADLRRRRIQKLRYSIFRKFPATGVANEKREAKRRAQKKQ